MSDNLLWYQWYQSDITGESFSPRDSKYVKPKDIVQESKIFLVTCLIKQGERQ